MKVLDQENNSTAVIIWVKLRFAFEFTVKSLILSKIKTFQQFQGGDNQLWNAVPVSFHHDIFYIQNVASGLVIRNMG